MENLFKPEKVSVVGASRHKGKTGHEVFDNLKHHFQGEVVPVNPNAEEVEGVSTEEEIPDGTDLAVIVVPSKIVPDVMRDAAEKNVGAVILISAGFSETGNEGLEEEIVQIADENNIDLLGPNVLGLINTENGLNASFASKTPEKGEISFMSQSGAFCTAILDYAKAEHIGFRHFVSLGNKARINEVDLLDYWKDDKETEVILSYTEGIENGREFIKKAAETTEEKPVIMVKSGRTNKGGEAASSHTGSIAGSHQAYQAAFRKTGIIEAESNRELLNYGRSFAYQPLPKGDNIAIITNAGGPGVITTDEVAQKGMSLAEFSEQTKEELEEQMPPESTPRNPLDVIGDAGHERYEQALESIIKDENVDAVILILTPQANTEIKKTAKTIVKEEKNTEKPVMACFIGEKDVEKGKKILEKNEIPEFEDPVSAVKSLKAMNRYRQYREKPTENFKIKASQQTKEEKTEIKSFEDSKDLLEKYGFQNTLSEIVDTPKDAKDAASRIGYPVVLKVDSPDIHHKSDIGAIKTGIENRENAGTEFHNIIDNVYHEKPDSNINGVVVQEQVDGMEIALGMKRDPQFGPMIMVGLGGIYIEALHDITFGIAPISEREAEQMIEELESSDLFKGVRGEKSSLDMIEDAITNLGNLAMENEYIDEIDLNPLILTEDDLLVTDIEIIQ